MNPEAIYQYTKKGIGIPLIIWGIINILSAVLFFFNISDLLNGIAIQAFFWGLIDGIIGLAAFFSRKKQDPIKIKKILFINIFLDMGYILGAIMLIIFSSREILIGSGYGIIIQGVFLFVADIVHHRKLSNLLIDSN